MSKNDRRALAFTVLGFMAFVGCLWVAVIWVTISNPEAVDAYKATRVQQKTERKVEVQQEPKSVPYIDRDNSNMAQIMSKESVRKILVAPSTAKFPGIFERQAKVTIIKPRVYKVVWYVDSQNRFGAMIRSKYSIVMTQTTDDDWSSSDLVFDGEQIY